MSVHVDTSGLDERFGEPGRKRRQRLFAMRAALLMRKYVPLGQGVTRGALRASEAISSRYDAGQLVWSTEYAAKQYYGQYRHTTPGTTRLWDQTMVKSDGDALRSFADALVRSKR